MNSPAARRAQGPDWHPADYEPVQRRVGIVRFVLPRVRDVVFIAVFLGVLLLGERMLNTDADLGRDLTVGRYILSSGQIPVNDILSFTKAGQLRPPYEWLAQVSFAIGYHLLNLNGVVLASALVIAAAFVIVYEDAARRSHAPVLALLITLSAAVASSLHWLSRPHIFTFAFLAIWLCWLERLRSEHKHKTRLWLFPLLMLVWANTHGGFVFGFLAWAAYVAGWLWGQWRGTARATVGADLLIVGATSLVASAITPALWHNWDAVLNNRSAFILSHTIETLPPNLAQPGVWPFVGFLVLALLLLLLRWRQVDASHCILLAGFSALALIMARNIPLFVIASAPIMAEWTRQTFDRLELWLDIEAKIGGLDRVLRGNVLPVIVVLVAAGLFAFQNFDSKTTFYDFSSRVFPVQAADWLESHPVQGHMFNDFNWGGYLLYRLWPAQRVFIDSQSDFYGEALVRQYESIAAGDPNWESELRHYTVNWIIVPSRSALAARVRGNPAWAVVYEDNLAVIFEQK